MKKINFGEMLKQAWGWTVKNPRLWWLGLFIGLGGLVSNFRSADVQDAFVQVFKDGGADGFKNFFTDFTGVSILVFWLLAIFAVLSVAGMAAGAGIVLGVKKIKNGEKRWLRDLIKFGCKKIPRLLLLEIILGIPYYALLVPVGVYSVFIMNRMLLAPFAICLGALALYSVFVALFKHYAYCYAILEEQTAWQAIVSGINLLKSNFWSFVAVKLIQAVLWIAVAVGVSLAAVAATTLIMLIGSLFSLFAGAAAEMAAGAIGGITGVLIFLVFRAGANVFFQSYLTGVFWEARE